MWAVIGLLRGAEIPVIKSVSSLLCPPHTHVVSQFHLTSVTAPRLTSYKVTLNLSRFFPSLPLPEIESILDRFPLPTGVGVEQRKRFVVNEEGWLVFFTESWDLNERFWLESVALDSI